MAMLCLRRTTTLLQLSNLIFVIIINKHQTQECKLLFSSGKEDINGRLLYQLNRDGTVLSNEASASIFVDPMSISCLEFIVDK